MHRSSAKPLSLSKSKQDKKEEIPSATTTKVATTPIAARKTLQEDEYSPILIRCTQDGGDDELDVGWDWNSPQSRAKKSHYRQRKRPNNVSPQIPRKIHSKHNLIPQFTSLKAELEKLNRHDTQNIVTEETDLDDNLLVTLTPELNDNVSAGQNCTDVIPGRLEGSDLLADDSFNEELIKCSQMIEADFTKPQQKKIDMLVNTHNSLNIADDSFDDVLTKYSDEDMVRLSQETETNCVTPVENTSRTIYRTNSTPVRSDRFNVLVQSNCSTPLRSDRFPRTKSAEDFQKLPRSKSPVIMCSPDEIEKKRLEAKARLELKKTQNEIEKKRLETLELKKTQNEIERKRLEALELKKTQNEIEKKRLEALELKKTQNEIERKRLEALELKKTQNEIERKRLEALELKKTQNEIEKKRLEALEKLKRNRIQRNAAARNSR